MRRPTAGLVVVAITQAGLAVISGFLPCLWLAAIFAAINLVREGRVHGLLIQYTSYLGIFGLLLYVVAAVASIAAAVGLLFRLPLARRAMLVVAGTGCPTLLLAAAWDFAAASMDTGYLKYVFLPGAPLLYVITYLAGAFMYGITSWYLLNRTSKALFADAA